MPKRKLTQEEESISRKQAIKLAEEYEYYTFAKKLLEHNQIILEEQLKWELYERKKGLKQKIAEINNQLQEVKFTLDTVNEQLKNGVEIKGDAKKC